MGGVGKRSRKAPGQQLPRGETLNNSSSEMRGRGRGRGHLDSAFPEATLNSSRSEMRTSAASSLAPACHPKHSGQEQSGAGAASLQAVDAVSRPITTQTHTTC